MSGRHQVILGSQRSHWEGEARMGRGLSHLPKALEGAPLPRQGPGQIVSFQIPTSTAVVQKRT